MKLKSLSSKLALVGSLAAVGILGTGATAFAATTTQTATVTAGSLSVSASTPGTISVPVSGTSTGSLPASVWTNNTGSTAGWTGSVAASNLTYTGKWVASSGSTALTSASAGAYTGTADGLSITATVTASGTLTWKEDIVVCGPCANPVMTATFTAGTPVALTSGITIDMPSGATTGSSYTVEFGTQASGAMSLLANGAYATITDASGNTDSPPYSTLTSNTPLTAPASGSSFGSAVPFLEAVPNRDQGMGSFDVTPAIQLNADQDSWVGSYVANIEYSIASGPTA